MLKNLEDSLTHFLSDTEKKYWTYQFLLSPVSSYHTLAIQTYSEIGSGTVKRELVLEFSPKIVPQLQKLLLQLTSSQKQLMMDLKPVVVFSDHVKPVEMMELELSRYRVRKITGEVSSDKRQDAVDLLNNGQLDVLICTIGSASTGFNLTASSLLIFNDPSWVSTDMEQAKKRIHRIGAKKPCRIINVIGSKTDEHIYQMLAKKDKVINKVIKER